LILRCGNLRASFGDGFEASRHSLEFSRRLTSIVGLGPVKEVKLVFNFIVTSFMMEMGVGKQVILNERCLISCHH